jgi:uncharacterized membrane-anchored protein
MRASRIAPPPAGSKVPRRITALFWTLKLLTTAMGESISDFLVHRENPYAAVIGGFVVFAVALGLQLRTTRYSPWAYWFAVAMVAVFGTMAADVLHVEFRVPYVASTIAFAVALAAVFVLWHRTERTLYVHAITTARRERFYWAAVLATFALGTAAGDWTAVSLHLGFLGSGVLFAVAIAVPALAHRFAGLDPVLAFWTAYVITRPLGASFSDWIAVPASRGGLDLGTGLVSVVELAVFIVLVVVLSVRKRDVEVVPAAA